MQTESINGQVGKLIQEVRVIETILYIGWGCMLVDESWWLNFDKHGCKLTGWMDLDTWKNVCLRIFACMN